jgi:hypothetical protein
LHFDRLVGVNRAEIPSSLNTGCATMGQTLNVNPVTEHCTFLRLFVTNSGGW